MRIDKDALDYSKYKMPEGLCEEKLKEIVFCQYKESLELKEDELFNRISLLREYMELNKVEEMFKIKEHFIVGNMIDNYFFVIRRKREMEERGII